jgi:selenophosphate synthetase-related protein
VPADLFRDPATGDLAEIARRFAGHPGLQAKAALRVLTEIFGPTDWVGGPGDDAAAIPSSGGFLLAAAEALWPPFVEADPFGAGIAAVVANVNDIAAMGGRVTALADTAVGREPKLHEVLRGLHFACELYGVRVVGGHLSVWDGPPSLSVFALGHATNLLSARNVAPGQALLAAFCLQGHLRTDFPFFSSVSARGADLAGDVEVLPTLAEDDRCVAAKDISMAGMLGSLAMLLEASGAGAVVDIEQIPRPPGVARDAWLFAFPTFGFLLCCPNDKVEACRTAFHARDLSCEMIGTVEATGRLRVRLRGEEITLLDFSTTAVTGLGGCDPG